MKKNVLEIFLISITTAFFMCGCRQEKTESGIQEQALEYLSETYQEPFQIQEKEANNTAPGAYIAWPKRRPDLLFTVAHDSQTGEYFDDYISKKLSADFAADLESKLAVLPGEICVRCRPMGELVRKIKADATLEDYIKNLHVKMYTVSIYYRPEALDAERFYRAVNSALSEYGYLDGFLLITVIHTEGTIDNIRQELRKEEWMYDDYIYEGNGSYSFGETITGGAIAAGLPEFISDCRENL